MQSPIQAKLVSIRRVHRREELEYIFSNKRKLLLQVHQQSSPFLLDLFHNLQKGVNLPTTIIKMMNLLSEDNPFLLYSSDGCPGQQTIIQFCLNLSELVLGRVIRKYRTDNKIDNTGRLNCLGIVINLLADERCPNHLLAPSIASFLKQTYDSVEIWGVDKQIIQVGWLVGNLIGNTQIVLAHDSVIESLLQWVQQLCQLKDEDMVRIIYRGMGRMLPALQDYYELGQHELPQMHKSRIINIICLTVEKNIRDYPPNTLLEVIWFVNISFPIMAASCPFIVSQAAFRRSIPFMGSMSKRLIKGVCRLCNQSLMGLSAQMQVRLRDRCQRVSEWIQRLRLFVVDNFSNNLLTLLCLKQMDMKVEILAVILTLMSDNPHSSYIVGVFLKTGIEDILANIADSGHQDVIIGCIQVMDVILRHAEGVTGQRFFASVEKVVYIQKIKVMIGSLKDLRPNEDFSI